MVLQVKVKTLDSQNYEFQAENDWTVSQFKEHIQEAVNVPALEQRLIFCGRVLQNDKKLTEYDVDGRVIHLVRRPPPASDQSDNDPLAAGASDSNNNDGNFSREFRFGEDNNVLFSAMTLGLDGNMNQILRHIMTLQQALYSRTFGESTSTNGNNNPELELDRRLDNALRLLRITVNLIAECNTRLPPSSPIAIRGTNLSASASTAANNAEPINLSTPQSVLTAALSHNDLQADDDMQSNEMAASNTNDQARMTVDDSSLSSPSTSSSSTTRRLSRQALTTDDLPQNDSRPARPFAPINELRSRNENRNGPLTGIQRDEFYLNRYMATLNCSSDVQSQIRVLIRRYRELISMSRCGGLLVSNESSTGSRQSTSEEQTRRPLSSQEMADGNNAVAADDARSERNISESLLREARVLSQYVPRILHHHSHLQHALSDFTVDFSRGRLLVVAGHQQIPRTHGRHRYVGRRTGGPRPAQHPRSESSERSSRVDPTIGGSVTITATTVESPIISTATTAHSHGSATIVVASEPGQSGIHIPVSFPLNINTRDAIQMEIPFNITSQPIAQPRDSRSQEQSQPPSQQVPPSNQNQQGQRATAQETTSNSTQTAPRPFGIISGRIPLPFDYYLTCFSPFAHYTVPTRSAPRANPTPGPRIQVRTSRQQESASGTSQLFSEAPQAQMSGPANQTLDAGLTEVVSNIIGSIFRPTTNQPQQTPTAQNTSTTNSNPPQDPLLNMIPELVVNAASQILGGVFGFQSDANNSSGSQQSRQPQHQSRSQGASGTVMMDIDIDDNYSSQSESTYQDARELQSNATTSASQSQNNASSALGQSSGSQEQSQIVGSSGSGVTYTHEQLSEILQNHPDWIPVIEADIRFMERQRSMTSPVPAYFSDAYLASIPRKRRRLLISNPETVLILQPSPSQAILNLLKRAIASSNLSMSQQDQLLAGIANDQELQNAYELYLKSAVEERLRTDEDYSESKYRNSSKYFK